MSCYSAQHCGGGSWRRPRSAGESGHVLGRFCLALSAAVWLVAAPVAASAAPSGPRSVLLIIADDFGLDVAGFYPLTVRQTTSPPSPPTPNLGRLARQGVRFDNAWANPNCSPTRATILTGRYGFRTGIGQTVNLEPPWPVLSTAETTLPEAFARAKLGHELTHVGKWHLGHGLETPRLHGWQHFSGPDPKLPRLEDPYVWPKVVDGVASTSTTYVTTDQVDDALGAIDHARAAAKPYLIWLALSVPHEPFHKPPNKLHHRHSLPVVATPDAALSRAYYEAMIEAMDAEIGRLLRGVDLATTTVIFIGDNGTPGEVMAPPYDPEHGKLEVYEQGVRVPLIMAGAGVAARGTATKALVNAVDLFPTVLGLAGIDASKALPSALRLDGVSLMPLLAKPGGPGARSWSYTERFGLTLTRNWQRAIRDGRFKLIERKAGLDAPEREFFDLQADPYERQNLLPGAMTKVQRTRMLRLDEQMHRLLSEP